MIGKLLPDMPSFWRSFDTRRYLDIKMTTLVYIYMQLTLYEFDNSGKK